LGRACEIKRVERWDLADSGPIRFYSLKMVFYLF
jgi:hypothetical protein